MVLENSETRENHRLLQPITGKSNGDNGIAVIKKSRLIGLSKTRTLNILTSRFANPVIKIRSRARLQFWRCLDILLGAFPVWNLLS